MYFSLHQALAAFLQGIQEKLIIIGENTWFRLFFTFTIA